MAKRSAVGPVLARRVVAIAVGAMVVIGACFCTREVDAQSIVGWGSTGFSNIDWMSKNIVKIASGSEHNVAIQTDGVVACWGKNDHGQSTVPSSIGLALEVAAGYEHSVGLLLDGSVRCWDGTDD